VADLALVQAYWTLNVVLASSAQFGLHAGNTGLDTIFFYFSPRMLQSVCLTFSSGGVGIDNSMQGIRPTTHPLLVLSLRLTALTTGWGY
jgi:hypothetical protein